MPEDGRPAPRAPDRPTVCEACGRRWLPRSEAHCTGCCRHFGSVTAFDRHLVTADLERGLVRCLDPSELRPSGTPHGVWHVARELWVERLPAPGLAQVLRPGSG